MDRINQHRPQTLLAEEARKGRAVALFISAVVFWHVAVSCMVIAKAMAPARAPAVTTTAR